MVTPAWLISIINLEGPFQIRTSNLKTFEKIIKPVRNVFSEEYNEDNGDKGDCGDDDRTERRRGGSSSKPEEPKEED